MAVDMGSAVGRIELDFSQLSGALTAAQKQTKAAMDGIQKSSSDAGQALGKSFEQAGAKMQDVGGKMVGVGTSLTKSVTLPLTALGIGAFKSASDFETAMAKVGTIADTTQKPLSAMEKEVRNVAKTYGTSANEIAEATYQAISAGVDTGKSVEFVANANKLAIGGFTDVTTAVDVVTTAINAYGLEADDAAHISDVLVQTQNKGKTSVGELAGSLGKVIPTANAYGVSLEQLGQAYSVMTAGGVKTADSTTLINAMLNELGKSGSGSARILKDQTGKSFAELSAEGLSLRDVLQVVSDGAEMQGDSFQDVFSSSEAAKGGLILLGTEQDAYNTSLEEFNNASGDTNAAYAKMADTAGQKLAVAMAKAKDSFIAVGQTLLTILVPYIEKAGAAIEKFGAWFGGLSAPMQNTIISIAGVAAAIGPLTVGIGSMLKTGGRTAELLGRMTKAFAESKLGAIAYQGVLKLVQAAQIAGAAVTGVMTGQISLYTGAQWLANAAISAFPVVAVALAIAGLVAGIVLLVKHLTQTSEEYKKNKKDVEELTSAQEQLKTNTEDTAKSFAASTAEINAQEKAGQNLVERLKNISTGTADAATKNRQMESVVSQLNGTVEGLNVAYDTQTGKITDVNTGQEVTIDQIGELTSARAALSQAAAWEERAIELNHELARAQEEQIVIANKMDDINANQEFSQTKKKELLDELQIAYNDYGTVVTDVNGRIASADEQMAAANTTSAQSIIDNFGKVGQAAEYIPPTLEQLAEKYGTTVDAITADMEQMNQTSEQWATTQEESARQAAEAQAEYAEKVINNFDEVPTSMNKSADDITAILIKNAESMANWEQNISKLSELAGAEGAAAVDALVAMGTQSSEVVEQLLKDPAKLKDYVSAYTDAGKGASAQYTEGLADIQTAAPETAKAGADKAVESTKTVTPMFRSSGQESASAYSQALGDGLNQATTVTQTAGTSISTALKTTTTDATAQGTAAGTGYSSNLNIGLQQATTATQSATAGAVQSAQKATTDMTTQGQQAGQGYSEGLKSGMSTSVQAVSLAMTGITGAMQTAGQGIKTQGQQAGQGYSDGLKSGMATSTQAVSVAMTGITGSLQVGTQAFKTQGQQAGAGYTAGLKTGLSQATTIVQSETNKVKTTISTFTTTMTASGQQAGNGFTNALKSTIAPMATNLQSEINKAKATVSSFASEMATAGTSAGKGFADAFKSGIATLTTSLQAELDKAKAAIASFASTAAASMQTAGTSMATAITSGFKTVGNWDTLGADVASGIASGITSGSGDIKDAAIRAARNALQAAKDELDINSPSRVFQDEVGAQIPAGIALGVQQSGDQVTTALIASIDDMVTVGTQYTQAGANKLSDETKTAFNGLSAVMGAIGQQSGQEFGGGVTDGANGSFGGLEIVVEAKAQDAIHALAAAKVAMAHEAQAMGEQTAGGVGAGLESLKSITQLKLQEAQQAMLAYSATNANVGTDSGKQYSESYGVGLAELGGITDSTVGGVVNTLDSFGTDITKKGTESGKGLTTSLKSATATMPTDTKGTLDKVTGTVNNWKTPLAASGKQAGAGLSAAIKTGFEEFKGWDKLGVSVSEGIAIGIKNGTPKITSAARQAAQDALDAAMDELGVNSPSSVFRDEVGYWLPLGMAEGFEQAMPQATRDMQAALTDGTDRLNTDVEVGVMAQIGDTFVSVYERIKSLVDAGRSGLQDSIHDLSSFAISGGAIPIQATQQQTTDQAQQAGDTFVFNETGLQPDMVARLVRAVKRDMELGFA